MRGGEKNQLTQTKDSCTKKANVWKVALVRFPDSKLKNIGRDDIVTRKGTNFGTSWQQQGTLRGKFMINNCLYVTTPLNEKLFFLQRRNTRPEVNYRLFFAVWKTQLGKSFATLFAAKDSIIMENKHFRAGTSFVSDFQRERKLSTGHCVFPSLKASGKVTTTS